jgi:hypothetical protein
MKSNYLAMGALGALLLAIGASHFFHEYQPRGRETGSPIPGYTFIPGATLAELPPSAFARLDGEKDIDYVARMTTLVHLSTYHCEPWEHQLSLPGMIVQNAMAAVGRDPQFYQGLILKRTLRCGFCSERAIALSRILSHHGIESHAHGLNGHVASIFTVDGVEYLADPDYGVGPFAYNAPAADLREIYLSSSIPELIDLVVPIIADRTDDYPYFEPSYLDGLKKLRRVFYGAASTLAAVTALLGAVSIAIALVAFRRRSKPN